VVRRVVRIAVLVCLFLPAFARAVDPKIEKAWDALSSGKHSFRNLGDTYSVPIQVNEVKGAKLVLFNELLARRLGLKLPSDPKELEQFILKNFAVMVTTNKKGDREMFATYYQDSGGRTKGEARGDGRAVWSGELVNETPEGKKVYIDTVLKGVGQTPLAWTNHEDPGHKDGLQSMEEAIHSFIMSEINLRNGLDTTMDLAVIELPVEKVDKHSGEKRKTALTVRVGNQTRIAHFRYFSTLKQKFPTLANYIIARDLGLPTDATITKENVNGFLEGFTKNLAEEAARYLDLNAAHSSPTVGNRTTKGSTIDLGTFRYLDANHADYTYLFDQLRLGEQTDQLKGYISDILYYMQEAKYEHALTKPEADKLDWLFDKTYSDALTAQWLNRMGISKEEQAKLSPEAKKSFYLVANELSYKKGKEKRNVGSRNIKPAAFDLRKILSESAHVMALPAEEQQAALEKLFLTERSWATLSSEDIKPLAEKYHAALKAILKELNPSDETVKHWEEKASHMNHNPRMEAGVQWVQAHERPLLSKLDHGASFVELTNDAEKAVENLLDHGIIPREETNLGHSERIGFFSGTFDPPHKSHLALIKTAIESLGLDKIYVIPNVIAEHKPGATDFSHRKEMLKLLLKDVPQAVVSDAKLEAAFKKDDMEGVIESIAKRNKGATLFQLMGTDSFERFMKLNPKDRSNIAQIVLNPREGEALPQELTQNIHVLALPKYGDSTSSTKIRKEIHDGTKPTDLSDSIYNYVKVHGLYASDCDSALRAVAY
jgi:nicotinate-nucleotide adenylyltransferase